MVQNRTIQSKEKRVTFLKYIIICLASFLLITATGQAAAAKDVTVDGSILGENSREQAK
ncbi:hypothetical protein CHCC14561_4150 [Bacillus licheniformis]|nr:hypothetical protein CHCC14561_4150 [Bacillus licheniformis]